MRAESHLRGIVDAVFAAFVGILVYRYLRSESNAGHEAPQRPPDRTLIPPERDVAGWNPKWVPGLAVVVLVLLIWSLFDLGLLGISSSDRNPTIVFLLIVALVLLSSLFWATRVIRHSGADHWTNLTAVVAATGILGLAIVLVQLAGDQRAQVSAERAEVLLAGPELSGINLQGRDLAGLSFAPDTNLTEANLFEADLTEANLTEVNLTEANLSEAILAGANLTDAKAPRLVAIDADLQGADLSGTNLSLSVMCRSDLSMAVFGASEPGVHTNLTGATLIQTKLDGADLATAIFGGADLSGASLLGTDLGDVELATVTLQGAIYDSFTTWPGGFDFEAAGALFVEDTSTVPSFECVAPATGGSQE